MTVTTIAGMGVFWRGWFLNDQGLNVQHYFMHVIDDGERVVDFEGAHIVDLDAAKCVAIRGIRSIVAESFVTGKPSRVAGIEICDADGELLLSVSVAEAVHAPLNQLLTIVGSHEVARSES